MSARELIDALLAACFPGALPPQLDRLVDRACAAELLQDFKLGPILPLGAQRPVRVALSNQGEPERWRREVLAGYPHAKLARFIDSVSASTRRMVDTDGHSAVVYLDDLQDLSEAPRDSEGRPLMFLTFDCATGRVGSGTRHPEPPVSLLGGILRARLEGLLAHGATGLWAIRWLRKEPSALIWISESRWRNDPRDSAAVAKAVGSHPALEACERVAGAAGLLVYPDALEARLDGSWDLTLGFCRE